MFGLSPLVERLVWVVLIGLFVVLSVWYERRQGAAGCELANTKVATQQIAHNTVVMAQDKAIVAEEKQTYDKAVAAPILEPIHISVCHKTARRPMPEAPASRSRPAPGPAVQPADQPDTVQGGGPDIGPDLQRIGKNADAQIAGLVDYIQRVCSAR